MDSLDSLLQFQLPENTLRAKLVILVKYKKESSRNRRVDRKKRDQRVQLVIQSAEPGATQHQVASLNVLVRHTKWQKILLPRWSIQDALRHPQRLLSLKVTCVNCSTDGPQPVLLFRSSNTVRRSVLEGGEGAEGAAASRRRGNRNRNRRDPQRQRANKSYNKRRPYLLIKVSSRRSPRSITGSYYDEREQHPVIPRSQVLAPSQSPCTLTQALVNFKDIGWDWVIAPQTIEQNFCLGQCGAATKSGSVDSNNAFDQNADSTHLERHASHSFKSCLATRNSTRRIELTYLDSNQVISRVNISIEQPIECGCGR